MTELQRLTVTAVARQADSVVAIELIESSGAQLAEWTPGAHVDLRLPSGTVRQYSLCGDVANRHAYRIGVLLEPQGRGGSREAHNLVPGDTLECSLPRNRFALEAATGYVFIAGGIGITPLMPMVDRVHRDGAAWTLLYGGRSRGSMAFLEELPHHSGRVAVRPQDEYGLLDMEQVGPFDDGTLVYCCGPTALIAAVESRCDALGCRERLRRELFTPAPASPLRGTSGAFDVQLGHGGPELHVAEGQSVLEALLDAGVDAMYSCREGTVWLVRAQGTCREG